MGNANSTQVAKRQTSVGGQPNPSILSHSEWLLRIQEQKNKYHEKLDDDDDDDSELNDDDYMLFIDYLIFKRTITGYSDICIVARMVRHYVGSVHGTSVFADNAIEFDGIRIAIAIHPITAQIYIADESRVYHMTSSTSTSQWRRTDSHNNNSFEIVAEIAESHRAQHKLTDLTFSADGERMFCLMDNDLSVVHNIIINNDAIPVERRIEYASNKLMKMDYLCFDFNHYYFDSAFFGYLLCEMDVVYNAHLLLATASSSSSSHVQQQQRELQNKTMVYTQPHSSAVLYTLDSYQQTLWLICNSLHVDSAGSNIYHHPLLIRIPFEFVRLTRQIQSVRADIQRLSGARDAADATQASKTLKTLKAREQMLMELRLHLRHQCGMVSLPYLLQRSQMLVIAFDVDRLHGGVYIITRNKMFARIEHRKKDEGESLPQLQRSDSDVLKLCRMYSATLRNEQHEWRVTHKSSLRSSSECKVLPHGYPLGVCNVRYDSISGKVLIADNYKMQALHI